MELAVKMSTNERLVTTNVMPMPIALTMMAVIHVNVLVVGQVTDGHAWTLKNAKI